MNTTELKGNWSEQKGKLKKQFAVLTDNDLMFEEGKKDEMLGKLQKTLGKTKEELHNIINALEAVLFTNCRLASYLPTVVCSPLWEN